MQVSESSSVRVVVSRVSKRRLLAGMSVGQGVQEGGLARVGVAHDGHHRHLVFLPALALGGPHPADLPQLPLQLGDLAADEPPVGLQLGLAGAAGADGGLAAGRVLPHQMAPHAGEAGQQIFVLGQLHLEPPLAGGGPLGEDVQDEGRAIQHLDPQVLGEGPLLGGREVVVEDHQVGPRGLHKLFDLPHLALAQKGPGIGGSLVLQDSAHALSPRRLQQRLQLLQ